LVLESNDGLPVPSPAPSQETDGPSPLPLTLDLPRVRAALEKHNGNITRAAKELDVWKPYLSVLLKNAKLSDWARELREKSGSPATGRPKRPRPSENAV